jgi:hypothetical protein
LAALFFPKEKVTAYAADLGIKDVKTLELWKETSIKKYMELYSENSMILPLTLYLKKTFSKMSSLEKYNTQVETFLAIMGVNS